MTHRRTHLFLAMSGMALALSASAEDGLTTPLWIQHTAPGSFTESTRAVAVGGGQLDANLSTRYRLRWNGFASDQDVYTYARGNLVGVALFNEAKLDAHVFLRAGFDLDGDYHRTTPLSTWYVWRDLLDTERDGRVGALRAYTANVTLRDLFPLTTITGGRTYVSHLETIQLDGGEVQVGNDAVSAFVFGGRPVSFFFDTKDDWTFGGGGDVRVLSQTRLRAEYHGYRIEGVHDDTITARVDQGLTLGPAETTLSAEYRYLDGPSQLELSAVGRAATGTTVTLRFRALLDDVGLNRFQAYGFPVNPFTLSLDAWAKHELYRADVSQAVGKHLLVAAGIDVKRAHGSVQLDNASYRRYRGQVDLDALPLAGSHLQVTGEYWDVDAVTSGRDNGRLHVGAKLSQALGASFEAWAGTSWQEYRYDDTTGQQKSHVRNYYVGAQWSPLQRLGVLVDFNAENSDVFAGLGTTSFDTNYTGQAMLTVAL